MKKSNSMKVKIVAVKQSFPIGQDDPGKKESELLIPQINPGWLPLATKGCFRLPSGILQTSSVPQPCATAGLTHTGRTGNKWDAEQAETTCERVELVQLANPYTQHGPWNFHCHQPHHATTKDQLLAKNWGLKIELNSAWKFVAAHLFFKLSIPNLFCHIHNSTFQGQENVLTSSEKIYMYTFFLEVPKGTTQGRMQTWARLLQNLQERL